VGPRKEKGGELLAGAKNEMNQEIAGRAGKTEAEKDRVNQD